MSERSSSPDTTPEVTPSRNSVVTIVVETNPVPRQDRRTSIAGPSIAGSPIAGQPIAGSSIAGPSIAGSSIAGPSIAGRPIAGMSIAEPPIAGSPIAEPPITGPSNAGPSIAGPSIAEPPIAGLSNAGPSIAGPSNAGPSIAGPSIAGPSIVVDRPEPVRPRVRPRSAPQNPPAAQRLIRARSQPCVGSAIHHHSKCPNRDKARDDFNALIAIRNMAAQQSLDSARRQSEPASSPGPEPVCSRILSCVKWLFCGGRNGTRNLPRRWRSFTAPHVGTMSVHSQLQQVVLAISSSVAVGGTLLQQRLLAACASADARAGARSAGGMRSSARCATNGPCLFTACCSSACWQPTPVPPPVVPESPMTREKWIEIIRKHGNSIEEYITTHYPLNSLEYLLYLKLENKYEWKVGPFDEIEAPTDIQAKLDFMNTITQLPEEPSEEEFAFVFGMSLVKTLDAVAFRIYKMNVGINKNIVDTEMVIRNSNNKLIVITFGPHPQVFEAAQSSRCLISSRLTEKSGSVLGLFFSNPDYKGNMRHIQQALLVPLLVSSGETLFVVEMWRPMAFNSVDLRVANTHSAWGSAAFYFCLKLNKQTQHYEFSNRLLDTLKYVFQEMISLDVVIQKILIFVQQLVHADRASLFMVDRAKNELVSSVFDQTLDDDSKVKHEIRIPMGRGIAGIVATSGELMNIPDAYQDPRFNREVDEATGYRTTSILCMPVKVEDQIIGVVQMVNKRNGGRFRRYDINSFYIFESFFGLALHHAKLYEKIKRNEQKYKVALEVLSYHNTCKTSEVEELVSKEPHTVSHILDDYFLDPYSVNVKEKCQAVMIMFHDLFGMENFDSMDLTRFILTVRKNYRDVPYHNFNHGWAVAQTMYAILKNETPNYFSYKQRLALFVASLCHDLDHRGYTNKYMSETESPLAAMYSTSTLEHHHFNITVSILQQDGHNIFAKFSGEEYREMLGLIKTCILATDLAVFYENLQHVKQLLYAELCFNWENSRNLELAMAMSMTAADLSASAKPWNVQLKTVQVIIEEFYKQGDKERAAGRDPIPMMDRNKPEELPVSQVGFLSSTCLPCYRVLKILMPNTVKLHDMAIENLKIWQQNVDHANKPPEEEEPEEDTKCDFCAPGICCKCSSSF